MGRVPFKLLFGDMLVFPDHNHRFSSPSRIRQLLCGGLRLAVEVGFLRFGDVDYERWFRKSAQDDRWSFCLTAGTLCPANQEKP